VFVGLRDRSMLLTQASTAFCGESAHNLELSDLFMSSIPVDDVRPGFQVPVGAFQVFPALAS
jgi:hypothetical protein